MTLVVKQRSLQLDAMSPRFLMLTTLLLAVGTLSAAPIELEKAVNAIETSSKGMTMQPLSTFNHGKPFLAERNPLTGTFDLKTTPVNSGDYLYEEFEDSGEAVDRKDEKSSNSPNHIISIPAKESELHKFLNLPVHYASSSKFPLISSSYANTKIQGHGVVNHRSASTTTSTVQPSYYPHRTANLTTLTSTTTSLQRFSSQKPPSSTNPPPAYEYEYEYDYNEPKPSWSAAAPPKSDFDFMGFFDLGESSSSIIPSVGTSSATRSSASIPFSSTVEPLKAETARIVTTQPNARDPITTTAQLRVRNETSTSPIGELLDRETPIGHTHLNTSQAETTMIAVRSDNSSSGSNIRSSDGGIQTKQESGATVESHEDKVESVEHYGGEWRKKPLHQSDLYSPPIEDGPHSSLPALSGTSLVNSQESPAAPTQITSDEQLTLVGRNSSSVLTQVGLSTNNKVTPHYQTNDYFQLVEAPQHQQQKAPESGEGHHANMVQQGPNEHLPGPTILEPQGSDQPTSSKGDAIQVASQTAHPQNSWLSSQLPSNYSDSKENPKIISQQPAHPQSIKPIYPYHKTPGETFVAHYQSPTLVLSGSQPEMRPVAGVWPQRSESQVKLNNPQLSFSQRPEKRPTSGVGTVEAVRPPVRLPVQKAGANSAAVNSDSQSYSLQTSFSIAFPVVTRDEGKVTTGTVSSVPLSLHSSPSSGAPQSTSTAQLPSNAIKFPPQPQRWDNNHYKPSNKESTKRKPLPNILPQFRPNAKVGTSELSNTLPSAVNLLSFMRAPTDRLQPPPLPSHPPRPYLRSDESAPPQHFTPHQKPGTGFPKAEHITSTIHPPQPVHRRNGIDSKVTTLQMLQSPLPDINSDKPLMVVYPSYNVDVTRQGSSPLPSPDFTNDDEFPHDLADARVKDTPILKGKPVTARPHIKVEFPYALVKPIAEDETRHYQAFLATSATPVSSESSLKGHRTQDYRIMMNSTTSLPSPTPPKRMIVPTGGKFGWSVIDTKLVDEITPTLTSDATTEGMSTTSRSPLAQLLLTGGFRPILPPKLE